MKSATNQKSSNAVSVGLVIAILIIAFCSLTIMGALLWLLLWFRGKHNHRKNSDMIIDCQSDPVFTMDPTTDSENENHHKDHPKEAAKENPEISSQIMYDDDIRIITPDGVEAANMKNKWRHAHARPTGASDCDTNHAIFTVHPVNTSDNANTVNTVQNESMATGTMQKMDDIISMLRDSPSTGSCTNSSSATLEATMNLNGNWTPSVVIKTVDPKNYKGKSLEDSPLINGINNIRDKESPPIPNTTNTPPPNASNLNKQSLIYKRLRKISPWNLDDNNHHNPRDFDMQLMREAPMTHMPDIPESETLEAISPPMKRYTMDSDEELQSTLNEVMGSGNDKNSKNLGGDSLEQKRKDLLRLLEQQMMAHQESAEDEDLGVEIHRIISEDVEES